jgi:hypothetical protein
MHHIQRRRWKVLVQCSAVNAKFLLATRKEKAVGNGFHVKNVIHCTWKIGCGTENNIF